MVQPLLGAIEAGGTKFVCGIGSVKGGSIETAVIPTRDPDSTFADVDAFFRRAGRHGDLAAVGIASFGSLDLDPGSACYGRIVRTPKPGWDGADLLGRVRAMTGVPTAIDTDVNAAALAEARAAGPDISSLAYATVGTGIGVGIVVDGNALHGAAHPEAGHILPRRHPAHDGFAGVCSFHGDCLEGLASGVAIRAAWGAAPSALPADHVFWDVQAYYLAQLCMTLFLTVAPQRIVMGGGVMSHRALFAPIHAHTARLLAGYWPVAVSPDQMAERIVPPSCVEPPGLIGAYLLAEQLL